jgi:hypothetical protein
LVLKQGYSEFRKMIYQYNSSLEIIAEFPTLSEGERITGIPEKTISSAINKQSYCRKYCYFSRKKNFVPWESPRGEKAGKKFVVTVTDSVWDRMLPLIGQRKKQDIFRKLLLDWMNKEEGKN